MQKRHRSAKISEVQNTISQKRFVPGFDHRALFNPQHACRRPCFHPVARHVCQGHYHLSVSRHISTQCLIHLSWEVETRFGMPMQIHRIAAMNGVHQTQPQRLSIISCTKGNASRGIKQVGIIATFPWTKLRKLRVTEFLVNHLAENYRRTRVAAVRHSCYAVVAFEFHQTVSTFQPVQKNQTLYFTRWKRINKRYKKCVSPSTPIYIHPPDSPPSVLRQGGLHHLRPIFDSMWPTGTLAASACHSAIAWICCKHLHDLAGICKNSMTWGQTATRTIEWFFSTLAMFPHLPIEGC